MKDTKHIRQDFYSVAWVLGGTWGVLRGHNQIPPCCLSVMLSPPKPSNEIQQNLVYELLLWMGRAMAIFFALPPGEGSKGKISFNFNYKVNFKDFYTKLCVWSYKWKIQNISDVIFILLPASCPRGETFRVLGVPRLSNIFFFKHGHVAYQINEDDEQNRMQVEFSSSGQTGDLGVRSKVKYH